MCAQFWCHEVLRYITLDIPFWAVRCVLLRYHDMSVLSWTLPLRNILIMIEVWWWWWWCVQLQQPQLAPLPGPGPGCWDNVTTVVIIHVNIHNQTRSWSAAATVCKETSNKAKQRMNLTRRLQCAINQGMFEQLKGFFISLLMASITISIAVLARRVVFTGYSGIAELLHFDIDTILWLDTIDTILWLENCFTHLGMYFVDWRLNTLSSQEMHLNDHHWTISRIFAHLCPLSKYP